MAEKGTKITGGRNQLRNIVRNIGGKAMLDYLCTILGIACTWELLNLH